MNDAGTAFGRLTVDDGAGGELPFHASDWRGASSIVALPERHRRASDQRPRKRAIPRRPTSLATERRHAHGIIEGSKSVLAHAFDTVRSSGKLDIDAMTGIAQDIADSMLRNPFAITRLTRLKSRHEYTYVHSVAVGAFMVGLARELEVDEALIPEIALAGLLHDIGKARMPIEMLDKAGPLSDAERGTIQTHPEKGHALLVRVGCTSPLVLDVCLHHHERLNGEGYPHRLAGENISIWSRIAAICDVYDAVTSTRAYKQSWSPGQALEWMTGADGHFDRRMFVAFRRLVGAFPVGTLVRLSSERLAVVVDGGDNVSAPPVVVFHCATAHRPLTWERIDSTHDPIRAIERPEVWGLLDWEQLRAKLLAA